MNPRFLNKTKFAFNIKSQITIDDGKINFILCQTQDL